MIRMGSTAGIFVPMRMKSRWGIERRFVRIQSSRSSPSESGSPPEIRQSRISVWLRMYSKACFNRASLATSSPEPTTRERVQ